MSTRASSALWISWEKHRRTREICKHFELPLYEFTYNGNRLFKYFLLIGKTTGCLLRNRPRTLLIQNPSIVLAFYATLLAPLFGYRLIVDAHNEAVEPYAYPNPIMRGAGRFVMKVADFTIVTNGHLGAIVSAAGGHPIILPDKLPELPPLAALHQAGNTGETTVALIATYAKDEPIAAILEAFGRLDRPVRLVVTGNPSRFLARNAPSMPTNVTFAGFLPDEAYWALLCKSDVIIDLTTKDNCLVCGAYEGVAAGTPLILSDNPATREYFSRGVVYTAADAGAIAHAMTTALARRQSLREEITLLRGELERKWLLMSGELAARIADVDRLSEAPGE